MAALITMGRVNAGTDQRMADVMTRAERGFHIGAIMRIYIHSIADLMLLRQLHQPADNLIIVGAPALLCTDLTLMLRPGKSVSHTAHIHRPGLCNAFRHRSRASVSHFLINGKMRIYMALRNHRFLL